MTTITEVQTTQVYQLFIRATAEQIWDAITKPEFTQKYFHGTRADFDLRPGGHYRSFMGDTDDVMVDGEVLESDPPHKLVHTWLSHWEDLGKEDPSRLTWEIQPQEDGTTLLTVVHDQLEGAPKTAAGVAGGWMRVLSGLKTLLETGEPLA